MADGHPNIEEARKLAALSPQTRERLALVEGEVAPARVALTYAFRVIGGAIASKRAPISNKDLGRLFAYAERLLKSEDGDVVNAVATDMLEAIWSAAHNSGFDFSRVDSHLGPEARRYLVAWDDFNKTRTPGLSRR